MLEENVILVNEKDEPIGLMPKIEAHEKAILHRAFSVFVLNNKNEIMLQQRARHKYHYYGPIRVAAINEKVKPISKPELEDCLKKWDLKPNSKNCFILYTKHPLTMV